MVNITGNTVSLQSGLGIARNLVLRYTAGIQSKSDEAASAVETAQTRLARASEATAKATARATELFIQRPATKAAAIAKQNAAIAKAQGAVAVAQAKERAAAEALAEATASAGLAATRAGFAAAAGAVAIYTTGVLLAVAALGKLAMMAAEVEDAAHNLDQTFGRNAKGVRTAADEQAKAFGTNRIEFLRYAEELGREYERLGINEKTAAKLATDLAEGTARYAASRRISFGAAGLDLDRFMSSSVTQERIRARAIELRLIGATSHKIDEGAAAIARQSLALEMVHNTTEDATAAGSNLNNQFTLLQGRLTEAGQVMGEQFRPAFIGALEAAVSLVEKLAEGFRLMSVSARSWADWWYGTNSGAGMPDVAFEADAANVVTSERNKAEIERMRKERQLGSVMGGGGGGGGGGFQGGLREFARNVQNAAWNNNQLGVMKDQLDKQVKLVNGVEQLVAIAKGPKAMSGEGDW